MLPILAGLLATLIYWVLVTRPPSVGRSAVKGAALGLPLIALALLGWPSLALAGLGLSVLGDVALSRPGALKAGIAAFALAHVAYIAAMLVRGWAAPSVLDLAGIAALLALGLSTRFWLLPHAGGLRGPVAGYVVLILSMGTAALLSAPASVWLVTGAALFIASDLILALELFRLGNSPLTRVTARLVWPLYILGQVGIMVWLRPALPGLSILAGTS